LRNLWTGTWTQALQYTCFAQYQDYHIILHSTNSATEGARESVYLCQVTFLQNSNLNTFCHFNNKIKM